LAKNNNYLPRQGKAHGGGFTQTAKEQFSLAISDIGDETGFQFDFVGPDCFVLTTLADIIKKSNQKHRTLILIVQRAKFSWVNFKPCQPWQPRLARPFSLTASIPGGI
jgi:hypothetical protein